MSPSFAARRSRSRRSSWRCCRRKAFKRAVLLAACGARAAAQSSVEAELRHNTQALLDAIAPGDTATWNRLLDSRAIQVDENDIVRDKAQILANLQPLGPGLTGHLDIDDFRVATTGIMAVVTSRTTSTSTITGRYPAEPVPDDGYLGAVGRMAGG